MGFGRMWQIVTIVFSTFASLILWRLHSQVKNPDSLGWTMDSLGSPSVSKMISGHIFTQFPPRAALGYREQPWTLGNHPIWCIIWCIWVSCPHQFVLKCVWTCWRRLQHTSKVSSRVWTAPCSVALFQDVIDWIENGIFFAVVWNSVVHWTWKRTSISTVLSFPMGFSEVSCVFPVTAGGAGLVNYVWNCCML